MIYTPTVNFFYLASTWDRMTAPCDQKSPSKKQNANSACQNYILL
jgi:hypothetical protein